MATSFDYNPYRMRMPLSAPATLERQKSRNNWFTNAKERLMRPWRKRRTGGRRPPATSKQGKGGVGDSSSLSSFNSSPYQYQPSPYPNFSRLSPLGGRPESGGKKAMSASPPPAAAPREPEPDIRVPENQPSRPPLSNILPMFQERRAPPSPMPEASKLADIPEKPPPHQRRHSTPATPTSQLMVPGAGDRRQSASSDTSMDKARLERRARRASATRDLPVLPKRGEDPLQQGPSPNASRPGSAPGSNVLSTAVSPYSEYTGPPQQQQQQQQPTSEGGTDQPGGGELNFGPPERPPVAPGGQEQQQSSFSSYSSPSWLAQYQQQPHQQLQELEEELEEDWEGDGEEAATNIAETPQDWYTSAPPTEVKPPPKDAKHPKSGKSKNKGGGGRGGGGGGGGGFGKKLLSLMSTNPAKEEPRPKAGPGGKVKVQGQGEDVDTREIMIMMAKEEAKNTSEVKGFDDFFMY